jgi:hypothetical protein
MQNLIKIIHKEKPQLLNVQLSFLQKQTKEEKSLKKNIKCEKKIV